MIIFIYEKVLEFQKNVDNRHAARRYMSYIFIILQFVLIDQFANLSSLIEIRFKSFY